MVITPEQRAESVKVQLAGIFEIGGCLNFDLNKRTFKTGTQRVYSYPQIAVGDSDPAKIALLRDWFGGTVGRKWNQANQWVKKGNDVPDLLFPMAPFAPSREMHLLGYELWQMTDDLEERLNLAREVQLLNRDGCRFPPIDKYQELIDDPRFLAGNFFARGSVRESHRSRRIGCPRVMFNTLNEPLVAAIKSVYGGNLASNALGGFTLDIDSSQSTRLLHTISPHLIYQDPALNPYLS